MGVKTCATCGKQEPVRIFGVEQALKGWCSDVCLETYKAWERLPEPRPSLRDYYEQEVLPSRETDPGEEPDGAA